jgi:hypothetical protein
VTPVSAAFFHPGTRFHLLLTCSPWPTRLLLIITLYAKLVLWKGDPTFVPGFLVGLGDGIIYLGSLANSQETTGQLKISRYSRST